MKLYPVSDRIPPFQRAALLGIEHAKVKGLKMQKRFALVSFAHQKKANGFCLGPIHLPFWQQRMTFNRCTALSKLF